MNNLDKLLKGTGVKPAKTEGQIMMDDLFNNVFPSIYENYNPKNQKEN